MGRGSDEVVNSLVAERDACIFGPGVRRSVDSGRDIQVFVKVNEVSRSRCIRRLKNSNSGVRFFWTLIMECKLLSLQNVTWRNCLKYGSYKYFRMRRGLKPLRCTIGVEVATIALSWCMFLHPYVSTNCVSGMGSKFEASFIIKQGIILSCGNVSVPVVLRCERASADWCVTPAL